MRVLIVRPEPGNAATAAAVAAMGLESVAAPLFEVVPRPWDAPEPEQFDAVVMTSANAARLGGTGLAAFTHLPLFAVGEATAAAARAAGFGDVRTGAGDSGDLGPVLPARTLHLTGDDHRPLPTSADVTVYVVYAAEPLGFALPPKADIALVHSPRAAARLAEMMPAKATTHLIAISPAAAHSAGVGWAGVDIADIPREHAMLATLARVCEAARAEGSPKA